MNENTKAVTIRGQKFESCSAAARHFKLTTAAISHAKRRGRLETVGLGDSESSNNAARPVTVRGIPYGSVSEAASRLDVSEITVRRALDAGPEAVEALGLVTIRTDLNRDELVELNDEVRRGGYKNLGELMGELARDYLAEQQAKLSRK